MRARAPETWRRPAVRRVLTAALLAVGLVATGLVVRSTYTEAIDATPRAGHPVSLGTWRPMDFGSSDKPLEVDARVVSVTRFPTLTDTESDPPETENPRAGGVFVGVVIECRCTPSDDLQSPTSWVVDGRGRYWDNGFFTGTYSQLDNLPLSFELGADSEAVDGVVTFAEVYEVPRDATDLGVYIDVHHDYLYR